MILLHRLDGSELHVNSDLIELIEANPDTVLTMLSTHKYVVRESPREIIDMVVAFRRRIFAIGPQVVN